MMPERLYYLFICYANNLANLSIRKSSKMPEFFEKSPLSGAGKHSDFQVTSCLQNDTTDVKFDD